MKVEIIGNAKEIAALVLAVQEQQFQKASPTSELLRIRVKRIMQ